MEEKPEFKEVQRIPLKLNLAISLLVGAFSIIYWPSILYAIAIFSLLYLVKMETRVENGKLKIKFFPFQLNLTEAKISDVERVETTEFGYLTYGGIGIRWTLNTKAYMTKPGKGIKLTREQSKNLVIGSQRPDKLKNELENTI
jgi:hypothetical protein